MVGRGAWDPQRNPPRYKRPWGNLTPQHCGAVAPPALRPKTIEGDGINLGWLHPMVGMEQRGKGGAAFMPPQINTSPTLAG